MDLAGEIIGFARNYFEDPKAALTPDTDLVAVFNERDPEQFGCFISDVSKRFGIKFPQLEDIFADQANPPKGKLRFLLDTFAGGEDYEIIMVHKLTVAELMEIIDEGIWPQRFVMPKSKYEAPERF